MKAAIPELPAPTGDIGGRGGMCMSHDLRWPLPRCGLRACGVRCRSRVESVLCSKSVGTSSDSGKPA